jgi:RNA polymerase sigma factor (sigma-70 family)
MRDDPFVADLVTRARKGDQQAWDSLVERYAPLIWSICRQYRLDRADAEDVGQRIWLQFVNHLGAIRDPAAVPGWLTTTTKRECGRVVRATRGPQAAGQLLEESVADRQTTTAEQELLAAERHAALHQAFTCLSPSRQQLMAMLIEDPPVPYAEISARLGIPVSSIGPTRRRCMDQIRRHPAIAALINAEDGTAA